MKDDLKPLTLLHPSAFRLHPCPSWPSHREILESRLPHQSRIVQVAPVEDDRRIEATLHVAETHAYLLQNALLLRAVHLFHRIHDGHLHAVLAGCVLQRLDVLGEARPAVAHSGIEEVIADTLVGADSMAHRLYVCAEFFGKI